MKINIPLGYTPEINEFKNEETYKSFITKKLLHCFIFDPYKDLLFEKFLIDHPKKYFVPIKIQKHLFKQYTKNQNLNLSGSWVYHPWTKKIFHLLKQLEYLDLRTVRNRNLVNKSDQLSLYKKTIAVAGLSVGANIILSLVRHGIGNKYKIADFDKVSVSNFNRSVYSLCDLKQNKYEIIIKKINEIDPFIKITTFIKGLELDLLEQFIDKTDLIIDAFDNFRLKVELRKLAKRKKIPVISGFDIEKGFLLIVERYDQDSDLNLSFFLNQDKKSLIYKKNLTIEEKTSFFINIIGKKYHSNLMLDSVSQVGKSLTGYPQLIIATFLATSLLTLVAENILLKRHFPSLRKFISLPELLQS